MPPTLSFCQKDDHFDIFFTMWYLVCQRPYLHLLFIFQKRMHQIMTTCFHSVRQKLHRRTGTFDLLGFDFLIDEDFKVSSKLCMAFVSRSAFAINLGDINSGKNRRRCFSSKSLLGNVTYFCDVKLTWLVLMRQPRFQAFSPFPQRKESHSSKLAVRMRLISPFPFSSPEPTILLACGRNRELWEQPFQACAIDAECVKPVG